MAELRIVTDSAASIPPQKAREWGVEVLPLRVHLGDEVYREGVDIQPQKLLEKLAATDTVPTVSSPPVEEFVTVYGRLSRTTEDILSLHVSRRICDVLPVARQASQEFLGRCRVTVVDSTVFDLGQRILVERAVRAARAGLAVQEVVRLGRGRLPRLYAIFFTENLN
ncbi:MAG: DegV family protein, partial [Anaerolineae bacterium]